MPEQADGQEAQAQELSDPQQTPEAKEAKEPKDAIPDSVLGLLFYVIIALVWAFFTEEGRAFLFTYKWPLLGAVLLIATFFAVPRFRQWLKDATTSKRAAFLIFVGIPLLLVFVIGINFMPAREQIFAVRAGFVLVASFLPATLYYLFIVTRKSSLLNEFVANMARLGLLERRSQLGQQGIEHVVESGVDRRRVDAYLQKFEAAYGPLLDEVREEVLQESEAGSYKPRGVRLTRAGVASVLISEAAVPVVIATFLIALLWFILLPPWIPDWTEAPSAKWRVALGPTLMPVTAAFLGAYFFSLQLLFLRYLRRDLRPSASVAIVLRILLAMIGIWVVERVLPFVLDQASLGEQ